MIVFLIDGKNRILHPTKKCDMVRRWLRQGRAKVLKGGLVKGQPILVQVLKRLPKDKNLDFIEYRIGIDPGFRYIGFCVFKINTKIKTKILLFSGVVETRTYEVKILMTYRRMYRRSRRYYRRKNIIRKKGKCKFRPPRFRNRRGCKYNPTVRHCIQSHLNLIAWILRRVPIEYSKIHIEYFKYDSQRLTASKRYGWTYQRGPQYGFENVKAYVRDRDNYTCQQCGKYVGNEPNDVHHIIQRSEGGTDTPDNLVLLCKQCHQKIHNGEKPKWNIKGVKLRRGSGVLNSSMKCIWETLESNCCVLQHTYGSIVKAFRLKYSIPKSHRNDAMIIAFADCNEINEELISYDCIDHGIVIKFQQFRRHNRVWVHRYEDRKYYVTDENGKKKCVAWNRNKRSGQTKPSFANVRNQYSQFTVKPGRVVYRTPNPKVKYRPGDVFVGEFGVDVVKGWWSTQSKVDGVVTGKSKISKCKRILHNSGMVEIIK